MKVQRQLKTKNKEKRMGEITVLLSKWNEAKIETIDKVFPMVYSNLKNLAKNARKTTGRVNPSETYDTLTLVNEVYIKLRNGKAAGFDNRKRFYAYCLLMMTNLLKDYYWKKASKKNEEVLTDEIQATYEDISANNQVHNLINLSAFNGYSNTYSYLELAIIFNSILNKLQNIYPIEVEVIILKCVLEYTHKEISTELDIKLTEVSKYERRGRIAIRRMFKSDILPILSRAVEIKDTIQREEYLYEMCKEDKDLLKDLEIILKEQLRKKN